MFMIDPLLFSNDDWERLFTSIMHLPHFRSQCSKILINVGNTFIRNECGNIQNQVEHKM